MDDEIEFIPQLDDIHLDTLAKDYCYRSGYLDDGLPPEWYMRKPTQAQWEHMALTVAKFYGDYC